MGGGAVGRGGECCGAGAQDEKEGECLHSPDIDRPGAI
jgi:hypothetical protein